MLDDVAHETFRRMIDDADAILLVTHTQADGDALGSELALQRYLRSLGKRCAILNNDPVAGTLRFLVSDPADVQIWDTCDGVALLAAADLIVLLDNAATNRLGRLEPYLVKAAPTTLCIDHHPGENSPWVHTILDTGACATAVMIYELVTAAGWVPDLQVAQALYVGIATDSGFFRFNSTDARVHRIVAHLLELGVPPAVTYGELREQNTAAYTRLLGHALTTLEVRPDGQVASVKLTHVAIEALGALGEDTSEITSHLLAIAGVQAVALFRERSEGKIKVSLRSKGSIDVNRLATTHGGGGHRNASGIVIEGTLDDVASTILAGLQALPQIAP